MITTLKLDLGPDQLRALGVRLTGRAHTATRAEVQAWAYKLLGDALDFDEKPGRTELRNFVCEKCGKPIALRVPKAQARPGARMTPAAAEGRPTKLARDWVALSGAGRCRRRSPVGHPG